MSPKFNFTHLSLSWSISRGRDTYGYNICRLDDTATDTRFRCSGGGYDMVGTVFAQWLCAEFQRELTELFETRKAELQAAYGSALRLPELYGATFDPKKQVVHIDGACGLSSVIKVAEYIGLKVSRTSNKRGQTTGFNVESVD